MSSAVRVLRFARPTALPASEPRGLVLVADVLLDEQPVPVGRIVWQFEAWHYLPADGTAAKLMSVLSRQDLEAQIARHFFGPERGFENTAPHLPLAM